MGKRMKFRRPKLHIQMLLGLLLGAIFGSVFHVDTHTLLITPAGGAEFAVHDWSAITLVSDSTEYAFGPDDQLAVVKKHRELVDAGRTVALRVVVNGVEAAYAGVTAVTKERTVATVIKPVGDIFIRLLMMISIPLVIASLIVGVASLQEIGRMARMGGKAIAYFMTTTAIAISLGLAVGNVVQPGHQMDQASRDRLLSVYSHDASARIDQHLDFDILQFFTDLVPKNPVAAIAEGDMLSIIFFSLFFGVALLLIDRGKMHTVVTFLDAVSDTMIRMVEAVMKIAPVCVFALISAVVGEFGFGVLRPLLWYVVTVVVGLLLQTVVVYPVFLKLFARKVSLRRFFREMRPAQLVGFSTCSSAATLPVNFECTARLGVPKSVTSFVLPLGATVNMDGTALYQGVATLFIAQVYGMDLTLGQQLTVVLTATLASIGTAPVPAVGIIMLLIVLRSVGVPEEGIALILGVDRFLDMCRTVPNITGDAAGSVIVASTEGVLPEERRG